MPFNINEFVSNIGGGLARDNLFMARITIPSSLKRLDSYIDVSKLSFLCKAASLPSLTVEKTPFYPQGFGKAEHAASGFSFDDLRLIFMVDSNYGVLRFFENWVQTIFNYSTYVGYTHQDLRGKIPGEFGYKNEYAATIEVIAYSHYVSDLSSKLDAKDRGTLKHTYTFGNAFPTVVNGIELAWENQAQIMTLPVAFTFDKYKSDGTSFASSTRLSAQEAIAELDALSANFRPRINDFFNLPREPR